MGRWQSISSSFLTNSDFIPQALGIQGKVRSRRGTWWSALCPRPSLHSGGMLSRLEEQEFSIRRSDVNLIESTEIQQVTGGKEVMDARVTGKEESSGPQCPCYEPLPY